ncbi:hypothetical protein NBRC10512_006688 [Rhodotorula toruloides]|uniref:RHTO0S18e02454g1_1 n=2 Tax=Rhodotorula toruloides TaxID=5286 RepID=A0A061BF23_RHOTO|nr:uncharacterized protein RHTO_06530 [Rhodotorula toruloides NP11]EMS18305.1 hypothetical protein RHTO_06530 [Rhodotorula toruloides NP11]CDR48545.1 RHTO0S18e02454g1_1 [Rhodotorula toruloides]
MENAPRDPEPSTSRLLAPAMPAPGSSGRKLPLGWETGQGWGAGGDVYSGSASRVSGKGRDSLGENVRAGSGKGKERMRESVGSQGQLPSDDSRSLASSDTRPYKKPRYFDVPCFNPSPSASSAGRKSSSSPTRPKFLSNRQLLPPPRQPSPPARLKPVPQVGIHDTVLAAKPMRGPAPLDLVFGGDDKPYAPFSWSSGSSSFYSSKLEGPLSYPAPQVRSTACPTALFTKAPPPHKAKLFPPQIRHPPRPKPPIASPRPPTKDVVELQQTAPRTPKDEPMDDLFEGDDSLSEPEKTSQADQRGDVVVTDELEHRTNSLEVNEEVERGGARLQAVQERRDERGGSPELFEGVSVSPQKPPLPVQNFHASTTRSASVAESVDSSRFSTASLQQRTSHRLSRSLSRRTPVYYSDDSESEVVLVPPRQATISARSISPDLAAKSAVRKEDHKVKTEPVKVKKVKKVVKEKTVVKEKKPQSRPPANVRTEDDWWKIDPDEQLRHIKPPTDWSPNPITSKAVRPGDWRILEFTLHKVAVPASDVVASIFEDGEWFVGLEAALVAIEGDVATLLSGHETELRLLLSPPPPSQPFPPTRSFVPDAGTTLSFPLDPSLAASASDIQLRMTFVDGSTRLPVAMSLTRTPIAFSPRHIAFSATEAGLTLSLNVLSAKPPVTPASAHDIVARRLGYILTEQDQTNGVWIPDPMAVRGHEVAQALPMPVLSGDRMGYDFATKLPYAPGDAVEVFGDSTLEHMRPFIRIKDDLGNLALDVVAGKQDHRASSNALVLAEFPPAVGLQARTRLLAVLRPARPPLPAPLRPLPLPRLVPSSPPPHHGRPAAGDLVRLRRGGFEDRAGEADRV